MIYAKSNYILKLTNLDLNWKCAQLVCYPGTHESTRDDGTNRETTGEGPGLRKQHGKKNRGS